MKEEDMSKNKRTNAETILELQAKDAIVFAAFERARYDQNPETPHDSIAIRTHALETAVVELAGEVSRLRRELTERREEALVGFKIKVPSPSEKEDKLMTATIDALVGRWLLHRMKEGNLWSYTVGNPDIDPLDLEGVLEIVVNEKDAKELRKLMDDPNFPELKSRDGGLAFMGIPMTSSEGYNPRLKKDLPEGYVLLVREGYKTDTRFLFVVRPSEDNMARELCRTRPVNDLVGDEGSRIFWVLKGVTAALTGDSPDIGRVDAGECAYYYDQGYFLAAKSAREMRISLKKQENA